MPCPNDARVRNKTMAFRCTPEEYEMVGRLAGACGMNKQEYIMAKLSGKEIVVTSSPRTRKAMQEWIDSLRKDLGRESQTGRLSDHLQEQLAFVLGYFNALCAAEQAEEQADPKPAPVQAEPTPAQSAADSLIFDMKRG